MAMTRRGFVQQGFRIAGLTAGGLYLVGCGGDEPTAVAPEATPTATGTAAAATEEEIAPLSVTGAGAASGFGFLMVNLEPYIEREGVSFEIRTMSPTDALVAAFSRQVDIANSALLGTVRAFQEDPSIRFLTPTFGGHTSVMTALDGPDSMEELQGARLGSLARASNAYNDLSLLMAEQGLDIETDFELTLGDAGVLEGLFQQGELDAFTAFEPIVTRLLHTGAAKEVIQYNLAWDELFGVRLPPASIAAHVDWIEDVGPDAVRAIVEASERNVTSFVDSEDRYIEHRDQWGLDDDEAITLLADRMNFNFMPEMNDEVMAAYEFYLDLAREHGVIEGEFEIEQLLWDS